MASRYIDSTKVSFIILCAIFGVEAYQAAKQPIRTGEAYIYDRFVRPTARQVLSQELLNRDFLYSLLEKRSIGLFHVTPVSVRIPSLLFGILYLASIWRLARRIWGEGRSFLLVVTTAGLIPLEWDCFSRADGVGAAVALQLFATSLMIDHLILNQKDSSLNLNLAGACLGLSVAARLEVAIPALVLASGVLIALAVRSQFSLWTDRILAPAAVVAAIVLALPLSHAHAAPEVTPELPTREAAGLQSALLVMRASAEVDPVRVAAIPAAEPIVNFYRAQHRLSTWSHAARDVAALDFDYYLLATNASESVEQRHLIVLYQDTDLVLARRSYAPM